MLVGKVNKPRYRSVVCINAVKQIAITCFIHQRNEQEREHWQREVLGELLTLRLKQDVDTLGNQTINDIRQDKYLANKLEQHTMETGNDIFSDIIIQSYLAIETNEDVRELVSNVWVGLWDAPDSINAGINTEPFYDGSYLVRFTSDLQILLRKVVELFTTELFTLNFANSDGNISEIFEHMLAIELHDIQHEDDEIGVKNLIDLLPSKTREGYHLVFEYAFLAGCAFVIFHEIGHQIQKKEELAKYFDIPVHCSANTNTDRLKRENNADLISMKIVKKMFGEYDAINWIAYSGILLCLLTLAVGNTNPTIVTDHPSIQDRYHQAKNFVIQSYGTNAKNDIFMRTDAVAKLLTDITKWSVDDWWEIV